MPKYKLMARLFEAEKETQVGLDEFHSVEDAHQAAWDFAFDKVECWAVLVEDEEE